jgi:hypothetical protein
MLCKYTKFFEISASQKLPDGHPTLKQEVQLQKVEQSALQIENARPFTVEHSAGSTA